MRRDVWLHDIPEQGLIFDLSASDDWICSVLQQALGDLYISQCNVSGNVNIQLFDDNIHLAGGLNYSIKAECSCCLVDFTMPISIAMQSVLIPSHVHDTTNTEEDVELVRGDLEIAYYDGDCFDLGHLMHEQIVLAIPMKCICQDDCKGLCSSCGIDLNKETCSCQDMNIDPRWENLKGFKPVTK